MLFFSSITKPAVNSPLLIELSGHVIEALLQQLHQALDELLLLIDVLIELIEHAVEG